jgi:ATPase subunit of ABC transporter with duplicated ATPase domains
MNDVRNILLIGHTGGGKSTLANTLINQNNNFTEVFKESAGNISETKQVQIKEFIVNITITEDRSEKVRYLGVREEYEPKLVEERKKTEEQMEAPIQYAQQNRKIDITLVKFGDNSSIFKNG